MFEPAEYLGSYGLGVYNPADGYAEGFGHTGQMPGYMTWAACLPEDQAVIVVLTNHEVRRRPLGVLPRLGPSSGERPPLPLTDAYAQN